MRGYACVGLHQPKNDVNVGAVLRACGCFGAAMLVISGHRYKRNGTDTMKAYRHIPLLTVENLHDFVPFDCVPVAVEIGNGGTALPVYEHPQRAFYIFGPEDGSLGNSIMSWCRDLVYVPTNRCLNLAATVNIVLYDRMAKSWDKVSAD